MSRAAMAGGNSLRRGRRREPDPSSSSSGSESDGPIRGRLRSAPPRQRGRRGAFGPDASRLAAHVVGRAAREAAASTADPRKPLRRGNSMSAAKALHHMARSASHEARSERSGIVNRSRSVSTAKKEFVEGTTCRCGGRLYADGGEYVQTFGTENCGRGYEVLPYVCEKCKQRLGRYALRQLTLEQTPLEELARRRRLYEVPCARLKRCLIENKLSTEGCMEDFMRILYDHFAKAEHAEEQATASSGSNTNEEKGPLEKRAKVAGA